MEEDYKFIVCLKLEYVCGKDEGIEYVESLVVNEIKLIDFLWMFGRNLKNFLCVNRWN